METATKPTRRLVTINDEATVRIVEEERERTGAATNASAARSLIQEAKALRDQRRLHGPAQQPATA